MLSLLLYSTASIRRLFGSHSASDRDKNVGWALYREDRAGGLPDHPLGLASDDDVGEAGPAVGPHDDQIGIHFFSHVNNLDERGAFDPLSLRLDPEPLCPLNQIVEELGRLFFGEIIHFVAERGYFIFGPIDRMEEDHLSAETFHHGESIIDRHIGELGKIGRHHYDLFVHGVPSFSYDVLIMSEERDRPQCHERGVSKRAGRPSLQAR